MGVGEILGAGISLVGAMGNKGPKQPGLSAAQSTLQDVQARLAKELPQYINRPYMPYAGPRIAPFSMDQLMAMLSTRQQAAADQPASLNAGNLIMAASGLNPELAKGIMSPYMTGVTDEIARLGTKNLQENVLPGLNTTFTGGGQFGSSRHADFTQKAIANNQKEISGAQSNALQAGFADVMNRALQSAQLGSNIGASSRQGLMSIGDLQRNMGQSNLDLNYSDFMRQWDFPLSNLERLMSITNSGAQGAVPNPTPQQTPNRFANALGGALTGWQVGGDIFGGSTLPPIGYPQGLPQGARYVQGLPWLR